MKSLTYKIIMVMLLAFSLAMVLQGAYHWLKPTHITETAIMTEVNNGVTFKGIYLRDESLIHYSGIGAISYMVADGGKLGTGTIIAEVYDSEEQIDILQELQTLSRQLELLKKISNPGTAAVAQPTFFRNLVGQRVAKTIYARELNLFGGVKADKEEIITLISTMQMAMGNIDYEEAAMLKILETEYKISTMKSMQHPPIESVKAQRSGYFISKIDGYEGVLSKASADYLTVDYINSVTNNTARTNPTGVLGKISESYEWYLCGVIDNRKLLYAVGDRLTFKSESMSAGVRAYIDRIVTTDNPEESILIIKCDTFIAELVQHRTETVEIVKDEYKNLRGIKVSRQAIRVKEIEEKVTNEETGEVMLQMVEYRGVYVKFGETVQFKKLKVIFESDSYVLTQLNMGEDYVALYDQIIVEGIELAE